MPDIPRDYLYYIYIYAVSGEDIL